MCIAFVQVTVKKTGDDTKYIATVRNNLNTSTNYLVQFWMMPHAFLFQVLSVGAECDLALLTVEDNEFWKDVEPLEFGGLPSLQVTII